MSSTSPTSKDSVVSYFVLFLTTMSLLGGEGGLLLTGSVSDVLRVDGTTFLHSAITNTYDHHGRLKQKVTISEERPDSRFAAFRRGTTLFEYDKKGNLLFSE